jgi:membrane protease subunit HflC
MNAPIKFFAPIGLAVLALFLYASAFIVNQWEVALKLRLGEIVDSDYKPGLHFMIPLINNVKKFDGRLQTLEARPQRFLTVEKKDVIVDSYAKWRITNPGQFFRSTGGDSGRTSRLLAERINTGLRDEFGRRTIQEVVSEDRYQLMDELTKAVDRQVAELGIEVVDVRVKKIDLPPEVSESVYERMRAERERVARDLRAKGSEAAERIRADADRQRTVIIADAYKLAEEARGEGDAKAAEIYAQAYNQDRDFYAFYRSLNAYRTSFGQGGDMLVMQPDSDFFRFFNKMDRAGDSPPAGMAMPGTNQPPAAAPAASSAVAETQVLRAPASAMAPESVPAPKTAPLLEPTPVPAPETVSVKVPESVPAPVSLSPMTPQSVPAPESVSPMTPQSVPAAPVSAPLPVPESVPAPESTPPMVTVSETAPVTTMAPVPAPVPMGSPSLMPPTPVQP